MGIDLKILSQDDECSASYGIAMHVFLDVMRPTWSGM